MTLPHQRQLLRWRIAVKSDRREIEKFQCTIPKPRGRRGEWRQPHPRPWELIVQSGFRRMRPPIRESTLLLGHDEQGLAAMCLWHDLAPGPGDFRIGGIAVALRLRGQDGRHSREALDTVLGIMEADADSASADSLYVQAEIHERNHASQRLFLAMGFTCGDKKGDGLREWTFYHELPNTE